MSGFDFWIATATDSEGDLHWLETLVGGDLDRQGAEQELGELRPRDLPASCIVEVFGPFSTAKPEKAKPEQYDVAAHIFNWARNSALHCEGLRKLRANFFEGTKAYDAQKLAYDVIRDSRGDIDPALISATDILRAGIMFLEWDGES